MTNTHKAAALLIAGLLTTGVAQAKVAAPAKPAATAKVAAPKPKISMAQARKTALRLAPGKITKSEYEKEAGGWRYSFDIQQKGHIQEIGLDAMTGKVVENKSEGKVDHD
ncbi:MAG: PepSY domain-containing protein [Sphingomicrobium sp.]